MAELQSTLRSQRLAKYVFVGAAVLVLVPLASVTAANAGKLGKGSRNFARLLGGPDVQHYDQAIALVVAETFEQARAAAALVRVDYAPATGAFDLAAVKDDAGKSPH